MITVSEVETKYIALSTFGMPILFGFVNYLMNFARIHQYDRNHIWSQSWYTLPVLQLFQMLIIRKLLRKTRTLRSKLTTERRNPLNDDRAQANNVDKPGCWPFSKICLLFNTGTTTKAFQHVKTTFLYEQNHLYIHFTDLVLNLLIDYPMTAILMPTVVTSPSLYASSQVFTQQGFIHDLYGGSLFGETKSSLSCFIPK